MSAWTTSPAALRLVALSSAFALSVGLAACGDSGGSPSFGPPGNDGSSGFLYVTSSPTTGGSGAVLQYAIGSDGSVTPLSVASVPAGTDPIAVAADPSGRYLYAVNSGDDTISQYAVGTGGGLIALSPAAVSVPIPPSQGSDFWVSIDPSGHRLYVVMSPPGPTLVAAPTSIAQYSIGSGGLLTPLTPASVTLSALASGPLVIDSTGLYAYLAGGGGGAVLQFSIAADGTVSPLALPAIATGSPAGVVIAPDGRVAYVLGACVDTDCDGQVSSYAISSHGSLSPGEVVASTGSHILPVDMVLNPSGSSAYLLTNFMGVDTNSGKLYPYVIDSSGAFGSQGEIDTGSAAVVERMLGSNLYVLTSDARAAPPNGSGGHIVHFTLDSGGAPTETGSTPISGMNPTGMAVVTAP